MVLELPKVRLGWLIDPKREQVHIYREDGSIEIFKSFAETLSGEEVMPDFTFELSKLLMKDKEND
jgi:Uma2 family endonuclease